MIERILVPTDFSAHADRALQQAIFLAKKFDAEITLLHVYHLPAQLAYPDHYAIPGDMIEGVRRAAEEKLAELVRSVEAQGVRARGETSADVPHAAILAAAEGANADLIVMGTRGLTGVKHVLLGSVAERTVRLAPCPVMTVRSDDA